MFQTEDYLASIAEARKLKKPVLIEFGKLPQNIDKDTLAAALREGLPEDYIEPIKTAAAALKPVKIDYAKVPASPAVETIPTVPTTTPIKIKLNLAQPNIPITREGTRTGVIPANEPMAQVKGLIDKPATEPVSTDPLRWIKAFTLTPSYYKWSVLDEHKTPPPKLETILQEGVEAIGKGAMTATAAVNPAAAAVWMGAFGAWDYVADKMELPPEIKAIPDMAFAVYMTAPSGMISAGLNKLKADLLYKEVPINKVMGASEKFKDAMLTVHRQSAEGQAPPPEAFKEYFNKGSYVMPKWMSPRQYGDAVALSLGKIQYPLAKVPGQVVRTVAAAQAPQWQPAGQAGYLDLAKVEKMIQESGILEKGTIKESALSSFIARNLGAKAFEANRAAIRSLVQKKIAEITEGPKARGMRKEPLDAEAARKRKAELEAALAQRGSLSQESQRELDEITGKLEMNAPAVSKTKEPEGSTPKLKNGAKTPAPTTGEPWQMTLDAYIGSQLYGPKGPTPGSTPQRGTTLFKSKVAELQDYHKEAVKDALRAGEAVPAEVLKGYPDIAEDILKTEELERAHQEDYALRQELDRVEESEMAKLKEDPTSNLFYALRQEGGVNLGKWKGTAEAEGIPLILVAKQGKGKTLDEHVRDLKRLGWEFESEADLADAIRKQANAEGMVRVTKSADTAGANKEPRAMDELGHKIRYVDMIKKRNKQARARAQKVAIQLKVLKRKFATRSSVPESKLKALIRRNTGQVKFGDYISEDLALRRSLQREENAAKKAFQTGRTEGIKIHQARAEEFQRKVNARKELHADADKLVKDIEGVRSRLKTMSKEEAAPIREILDDLDLVKRKKSTLIRLGKIKDYLFKNPDAELPDYIKERLEILNMKNLNDMTMEDLQIVHNAVMHYVHLQRTKNQMKVAGETRRADEILINSISEMKPAKVINQEVMQSLSPEKAGIKKAVGGVWDWLTLYQDHYNLVVEGIAGPNSTFAQVMDKDIHEGAGKALEYERSAEKQFNEDLDIGYFMHWNNIKDMGKWLNEKVDSGYATAYGAKVKLRLTRGERMALYKHSQNENSLRHIYGEGIRLRYADERGPDFKMTNEDMDYFLSTLTAAEKEWAGEPVTNLFNKQAQKLNEVHIEEKGYEMPREENYYPLEVVKDSLKEEQRATSTIDDLRRKFARASVHKGMLQARQKSKLRIFLNPIQYDVNKTIKQASAYIGLELPLRNAAKLIYNSRIKGEMQRRYGSSYWKVIEKGLRDIAGQRDIDEAAKGILGFKNNITAATLGLNPPVAMKQTLSYILYSIYIKPQYMAEGFANTFLHPKQVEERHRLYSPLYAERGERGGFEDISDVLMEKGGEWIYKTKKDYKEIEMSGLEFFDLLAIRPGMEAAVLQAMDELSSGEMLSYEVRQALGNLDPLAAQKLNTPEKMKLAYKFADWVTERTQPMNSPQYRSQISRSIGWRASGLTAYTSSTNVNRNLIIRLYQEAKRTGHWGKFAYGTFLIVFVQTVGEALINHWRSLIIGGGLAALLGTGAAKKKKKRDLGKDIALNFIDNTGSMFYGVGPVTRALTSKLSGNAMANVNTPLTSWANTGADAQAAWIKFMQETDPEKRKKQNIRALDKSAEVLATGLGIPYRTPMGIISGVVEAGRAQNISIENDFDMESLDKMDFGVKDFSEGDFGSDLDMGGL